MFGITPIPIFDPNQQVAHLKDFMVFFKPGDIVKFKPVNREEYEEILEAVESKTYKPNIAKVDFSLDTFNEDIDGYNKQLTEALYGH